MKPSKAAVLGLALLVLGAMSAGRLYADESGSESGTAADSPSKGIQAGQQAIEDNPYTPGSQLITIAAGAQVPLFILDDSFTVVNNNDKIALSHMYLGACFTFGYQYFMKKGLSIGGTLSGSYNQTMSGLSLFILPLSFKAAYWWSLLPFEFTASAELGGQMMRYNGSGMFGAFARAGGAGLYRINSLWSVGLELNYWFVPEIHSGDYTSLTRYGNFLEVAALAVYHL